MIPSRLQIGCLQVGMSEFYFLFTGGSGIEIMSSLARSHADMTGSSSKGCYSFVRVIKGDIKAIEISYH